MADSPQADDWTRLVMLSLAVLEEAAGQSKRGPVLGTIGLRAALAATYWLSDQSDREIFAEFWKVVTGRKDEPTMVENMQNICRSGNAHTLLHGICRSLGFEYSAWVSHQLGVLNGSLKRDREKRVPAAIEAMNAIGREAFETSIEDRRARDREKRDKKASIE